MNDIEPALTPEEWVEVFTTEWGRQAYQDHSGHSAAALGLLGEPFGFTWADVDLIRELLDNDAGAPEWRAQVRGLADRIAALLPPRAEP